MPSPPTSRQLLVTGASGFLGWYVCRAAAATFQVTGTYHRHPLSISGVNNQSLNLTDFGAIAAFFQTLQPDGVIHLAAESKPNACQMDPEGSRAINVTASVQLAELCAEAAIPYVFTSTDLVFDGHHAPYREADPVAPVSLYGKQKLEAEQEILRRYPQAAICRMSLMFGAAPTAPSFLQTFLEQIRRGEPIRLFTDEFRSPLSGRDAATGLLLALEKASGILHLGGGDRLSRYEFGLIMAEVFGLPQTLIQPCSQSDVPMPAPRPPDVSVDISRARALGFTPGNVREELIAIREGC
ncbi:MULTISPECIES: NAD(P)-dependent oxidoreductase [unclassified Leptolyngbya]|uniref:SDR family oxidoreductase n=1 Tax=unclassified Leptolyngbya TaxID=2650499 RepID=UPI001682286D|nr:MULTISPECIES: NAD(P)-dependent oxidoreductase [unclassified Leptolyngbya]MBD1912386.1 NAD(P)-dependent oxidoreductase [Leptolyngbya sp. FACHB-8]MBD2157978.1 NAD(P)-dependent oxidoreductase [Leptolyngbya sp. FACHB-16]